MVSKTIIENRETKGERSTQVVTQIHPPKAKGGYRSGSGRKPKPKDKSLLARAYEVLDEAQLPAVKAVVTLLKSRKEMVRLQAAKIILAKRIPDMTQDMAPKESAAYHFTNYTGLTEDQLFGLVSSRFASR